MNMEQRSKEWFKARIGKLTGSNIGAALGINPYKTPDDLIRQMVRDYHGAEKEFTGNIATEYGQLHEPLALMDYEMLTGNEVKECGFIVHPEFKWLGASPDGLVDEEGVIEIKCPYGLRNKKGEDIIFKSAKDQPHYYAQMQIEMACTERSWCDFFQWSEGGKSLERVDLDEKWLSENLPVLDAFYDLYLSELVNPIHLEDKVKEINTLKADELIKEYDRIKAVIEDSEARKKEIMAELIEIAGERNAMLCGRKLTQIERAGNVNYKKIPELQGVDLEKYRNKPSKFWKLS